MKRQIAGWIAVAGAIAVCSLGFLGTLTDVLDSPTTKARATFLNQDGARTVFTTYFYWFKSGPTYAQTHQIARIYDDATMADINANFTFPDDWPGPKTADDLIVTINGTRYHDYLTFHPPGAEPSYHPNGTVNEASLNTDRMFDMSDWFFWNNTAWHEWELRGMIRAGIDVLMPVYWWNGVQNQWSIDGLEALNASWQSLAGKLVDEGQATTLAGAKAMLPRIAMFYDTTSMKQLWAWNMSLTSHNYTYWWDQPTGADLNDPYWRHRFWTNIDDFIVRVDPEAMFTWNGSYVVWLYGGGWFGDVGINTFEYCRQQALAKHNVSLIFAGGSEWQKAGLDATCGWGAALSIRLPARSGIPAGGTGPGYYNLGAVYEQKPIHVERSIETYKANWRRIIDANTAWVHVETWNELHEGTGIGWAQEYGWDWIDVTREMVDQFHAIEGYQRFAGRNVAGIVSAVAVLAAMAGAGVFLVLGRRLP